MSRIMLRDWGHAAGYVLDGDGHVLAFARPAEDAPPFAAPNGPAIH